MQEAQFKNSIIDFIKAIYLYGDIKEITKLKNFLHNFDLQNDKDKRNFLKHNLLNAIKEEKKLDLGKYYTPEEITKTVYDITRSYLKSNSIILDTAAGTGAFLDYFECNDVIAGDIDAISIEVLKILGYENCIQSDALKKVSRSKYNIDSESHLIIVGNPPYNDITSLYKNKIKSEKNGYDEIDPDVKCNDLGMSFIKSFNKLEADVICIVHPLSYLIKKKNFKTLKTFTDNYVLKRGIIFSSEKFKDTRKTPFPILIALYEKNSIGMDYKFILDFEFDLMNDEEKFILRKFETIDEENYIRKYPPKKDSPQLSDMGLYIHNFRDLNSLITRGNFSENNDIEKFVPVLFKDFYKYAYLNCMRRYIEKDYKFGNLSPVINKLELESNKFLQDAFIIDTIIHNQNLNTFNTENPMSIIWTKDIFKNFESYSADCQNDPNIYKIFIDFVNRKEVDLKPIKKFITGYFLQLKGSFFKECFEKKKLHELELFNQIC
jgi:hypothetical protein